MAEFRGSQRFAARVAGVAGAHIRDDRRLAAVPTTNDIPLDAVMEARGGYWLAGLGIAGAVGLLAWLLGWTPWLLVLATLVAVALAVAQFANIRVGITASILAVLGSYAVLIRLFHRFGLGFSLLGALFLTLVIVGALLVLIRQHRSGWLVLPRRNTALTAAALLLVALLVEAVWIPWQTARGYGPVWAMHGDALGQMLKIRQIFTSGGVNVAVDQNSSPLTSALMAMAAVVGRSGLGPQGNMAHDVVRFAELWALMIFATAILAALITWRATIKSNSLPLRIGAVIVAALLPMTWYFSGFALIFGFYNSTLTLLILLGAWHIWLESSRVNPVLTVGLLSLATIALLATWAPLALIPAGLAALVFILTLLRWRDAGTLAMQSAWPLIIAALPIPLYGFLVTLRDFAYEGDALAGDGSIMPVPGWHTFWVLVVAALAVAFAAAATREWYLLWGLGIVYFTGLAGLVFLVWQRVAAGFPFPPNEPREWGYYPIKMAWALTSFLLVIGLAAIFGALTRSVESVLVTSLKGLLAVAVVWALMMQIGPWRLFFTPFDIIRALPASPAEAPWRANLVFAVDEPERATILVRYAETPEFPDADRFANSWLLQAFTIINTDPMRGFASWLNTHDDDNVCDAILNWNRPVTVLTTDVELEQRLRAICPQADFTVSVAAPTWPRM